MADDHTLIDEHKEHCDCYRQSRLSNASWVREYQELLARAEAAERRAAELERDVARSCEAIDAYVEALSAAERQASECRAWHCSGQRRCELQRGHEGHHFTTSLGANFGGWDDSASTDVRHLLEALNEALAKHRADSAALSELEQQAEAERWQADRICLDWAAKLDAAEQRAEMAEAERDAALERVRYEQNEHAELRVGIRTAQEETRAWIDEAQMEGGTADALRRGLATSEQIRMQAEEKLRAENAVLSRDLAAARADLVKYGRHGDFCPASPRMVTGHGHGKDIIPVMDACNCGFSDAR